MIAIAQFVVRRLGPLAGFALCSRGPLGLSPLDEQQRAGIVSALKSQFPMRGLKLIFFSPDDPIDLSSATAKLRRVLTGYSTVNVDLSLPTEKRRAQMHAKWRNRLVASETSALRVVRNGTKPAQINWLLEREGLQRQQRGYWALPPSFVSAFQAASSDPKSALLTMRADIDGSPVAAMMFLVHGASATYHVGWSDSKGREYNAHNLLLWAAMDELVQVNIKSLDLGGVNTQRGAGIARFKIGSGGDVKTFAGTFC